MFIVSILLILISSYLILSAICSKEKSCTGFLYLLFIAFAQIILSFEVLSLFKGISKSNFLICNIFFIIGAIILFIKTHSDFYKFNFEYKKISETLNRDKMLKFLALCFVIFLISELIIALFYPVTYGDALGYYLTRCTDWIQNNSFNHFTTSDSRELIMPINMDILYMWKLLFTKSEIGTGVFSYINFLALIYVIYNFLNEFKISIRQRLWTIFTISSFAIVITETYTPCSDLFLGTLIISGIYLYLKAIKYNNIKDLYFSSLAFAIGFGVKTTAVTAIPSIFIIIAVITSLYKNNIQKFFPLKFLIFITINFLIFSSYNYILNYIQFSNFITNSEMLEINKFRGGFKGYISNLIKYFFIIFDTSGIPHIETFNGFITHLQTLVLSLFGLTDKDFTSNYFNRYFLFNDSMLITNSALGLMGIFAFLPSLIKSIKRLFKNKSKKSIIIGTLGLSLIINILLFSRVMLFTGYNVRYLLTFTVIAFPVCIYSYIQKNKFFKYFLCAVMFIYLVMITSQIPFSSEFSYLINNKLEEIKIFDYIKSQDKKHIAIITRHTKKPNYYIEKLKLYDYKTDKILLENIEEYDLSQYDYIISDKNTSESTYIVNYKNKTLYPDLYISKCIYVDTYGNLITAEYPNKPVIVSCEIPKEYFKEKGFIPLEKNYIQSYLLFENRNKNKIHT